MDMNTAGTSQPSCLYNGEKNIPQTSFPFNKFFISFSFQLVDDHGKVKGWIDASEPGTGNWLKYVRSTSDPRQQNVMALQADDQVRHSTQVRDLGVGCEGPNSLLGGNNIASLLVL